MKKILIGGIIAGISMVLVFMVVGQVFHFFSPSLMDEYRNENLFRSWSDPLMSVVFIVPFITAFISAWIWSKVSSVFKNPSAIKSGISFGLTIWLLGISGMIISFGTFPVSFLMVLSWTAGNFIQYILAGIIFSKIIK